MRKALEQRLVERWPTWFNTGGEFDTPRLGPLVAEFE
jgi:hypothetical protein